MIEQLAFKLEEQQKTYFDRDKRELEDKLKLVQMESNLKIQEMKMREMAQAKPQYEEKEEKKKKSKVKKGYLDMLGKLILDQDVREKGDVLGIEDSEESEDSNYDTPKRESPAKKENRNPRRLHLNLSPRGPNYQTKNPDSPSRKMFYSPRTDYYTNRIPLDDSPPSPYRNPYYGHPGYPMPRNNYPHYPNQHHPPYPYPNPNPYNGNFSNQYPNQYGQFYGQPNPNMPQGSMVFDNEEDPAKRKKKRGQTIRRKKGDENLPENQLEEEKKP